MKKTIYILAAMVLGVLLSFLIHAVIEIAAIFLLTGNFAKYSLGISWSGWFLIHAASSIILLIGGIILGYWLGQRWWQIIYVEKRYRSCCHWKQQGYSLVELLVVIAIVGILASIIFVSLSTATGKARDAKRKADLAQIGRFLSGVSCYAPSAGAGDYDIASLADELKVKYPQYVNYADQIPRDPKSGTASESFYRYIVSEGATSCALYANLEKVDEPVTLTNISAPTPGGGTGVFETPSTGWNGSSKYFQVSR